MIGEITAVLVSWRDEEELLAAISALAAARSRRVSESPAVSLAIVANDPSVKPEAVRSLWPGAAVIVNATNLGLAPAANQAAAASSGDVLLFLNPDTRAEGEPFTPIARAFDADPRIVAVAPRLLEMDGGSPGPGPIRLSPPGREDQATFQLRRLPRLSSDARELLLLDHVAPNNGGRRRARYADRDRATAFAVEQAAAAAFAVRRTAFDRVGGFDERYVPAWYEDVDLCDRLGRVGTIRYEPESRFRHRGGESASRLGYDRFLPILHRNGLLYRKSRYGLPARAAYRALLAAGMILRLFALPVRRDVPRSRSEAARAYLRVLALALGLPPASRMPDLASS